MRTAFVLALAIAPSLAAQDVELTAMSFNVRVGIDIVPNRNWAARRELVIDVIRKRAPDVLCLQEDLVFQIAEIRDGLAGGYASVGRGAFTEHVGEYNSVLYRTDRFRLVDWGVFWLSETPERPASFPWNHPYPRTVVWCVLECTGEGSAGRRFRVYNTHFPHRQPDARLKCADLLARRIAADRAAADHPVLVLGDFNATAASDTYQRLVGDGTGLADAFRIAAESGPDHGTFHNFDGVPRWDRIDHIFVSKPFRVARTDVVEDHEGEFYPSDHFPIVARLVLGGA